MSGYNALLSTYKTKVVKKTNQRSTTLLLSQSVEISLTKEICKRWLPTTALNIYKRWSKKLKGTYMKYTIQMPLRDKTVQIFFEALDKHDVFTTLLHLDASFVMTPCALHHHHHNTLSSSFRS